MIVIEVRGLPAAQGSKRHVGGGRMVESSKAVGPWREAVRAETQRALTGRLPTGCPVSVVLEFRFTRPKGHYGTGRNLARLRPGAPKHPAGRPDVDKLARAVLDGLSEGGAWKDDSQVVALLATKVYAPYAGCGITIDALEDDE